MADQTIIPANVAVRLKQLRAARGGLTQKAMADLLGILETTWQKAEKTGMLSKPVADKLQRAFGVTPDWLFYGRDDLLPVWLARSLAPTSEASSPPLRRSRSGLDG